jgi:uroporphyrin-III C-methyltransferase
MNQPFLPFRSQAEAPHAPGKVWLVGAGPGDPDLLTLRAARLIMRAQVIVHDALVDPRIMALAPATARLVSAAKRRSRHTLPQDAINALLIAEARAGREVLRLKGGDPFIFGRGGEEMEACRQAGIAVGVVPGITAAMGAAAAAQMPLTHRDAASVVTFVAGQCKGLTEQNWAGLAGVGRTLVIYMGVANADAIAQKLMADGLAPETPLAVVENAARPEMRVVRASLAGLSEVIARQGVQGPAIIVIGAITAREDDDLQRLALEMAQ